LPGVRLGWYLITFPPTVFRYGSVADFSS